MRYAHQHEEIALILEINGVLTIICGGIGDRAIAGLQAAGLEVEIRIVFKEKTLKN